MPRYLVMVQWGAGIIYPKGFTFTAKDDKQAMTNGSLKRIGLDRKKRAGKKGAKPHGILLRVVKDERPAYGTFCTQCNRHMTACSCRFGGDAPTARRQFEGTGPEAPYLDLRGED